MEQKMNQQSKEAKQPNEDKIKDLQEKVDHYKVVRDQYQKEKEILEKMQNSNE